MKFSKKDDFIKSNRALVLGFLQNNKDPISCKDIADRLSIPIKNIEVAIDGLRVLHDIKSVTAKKERVKYYLVSVGKKKQLRYSETKPEGAASLRIKYLDGPTLSSSDLSYGMYRSL